MSGRRERLDALTDDFVDAFNRMDLDAVVGAFADGAVYEDSGGARHEGRAAIRAAFEPLVGGARGTIRFDEEDRFVDVEAGKVLTRWRLTIVKDGKRSAMRGLDALEYRGDELVAKRAYMKLATPYLEPTEGAR